MNNNLEQKMIWIFILIQPIFDLLTSIMNKVVDFPLTVGIVVRTIFMLYMIFYVLFRTKQTGKSVKYAKIILYSIILYLIIFIVNSLFTKNIGFIISEIKGIVKTFYFPIVLTGLYIYNKDYKLNLTDELLSYILLGYTGIIFIATVTGTNFSSYNDYWYGSIGWFFAANETGSIIAILAPFTVISLILTKANILNIVANILCLFTALYMGTKVPFLGYVGIILFLATYMFMLYINKKLAIDTGNFNEGKVILKYAIILLVGICILFYKSPIYKNLEKNYGHIIQNIVTSIEGNLLNRQEEKSFENDSTENITQEDANTLENDEKYIEEENNKAKEDIINALLSNRTLFANEVKNTFKESDLMNKLFGLGYVINIHDDVYTDRSIELDQLDILYRHGIIGTIVYFAQFIIIAFAIAKNIFKNPKNILNIDVATCIFALILAFGISFTAGHVLTAPGVCIFIILIILKLYNLVEITQEKNI